MDESQNKPILYAVDPLGIAILTANRPQARNALNWEAQEQFATIIDEVAQNENIRALIVTGAGHRAFVSGGDLKEHIDDRDPATAVRLVTTMGGALEQMIAFPLPVIAAVNGDAIGGGCEIITACDLRVASSNARFAFAQVQIGLTTGWGGTERLVRLVGLAQALDLLLTGRRLNAQEALEQGLIHRISGQGESALEAALAWARELVKLPREALAAAKALAYAAQQSSPAETRQLETHLFTKLWPSSNHQEALRAFQEKRRPVFNQAG